MPTWENIIQVIKFKPTIHIAICIFGVLVVVLYNLKIPYVSSVGVEFVIFSVVASLYSFSFLISQLLNMLHQFWQSEQADRKKSEAQKQTLENLLYLSDQEKDIFSWLVQHKQNSFSAAMDAGYAAPLWGKGLIEPAKNDNFTREDRTFIVPEFVWRIIVNDQTLLERRIKGKGYPWRIPWQLR